MNQSKSPAPFPKENFALGVILFFCLALTPWACTPKRGPAPAWLSEPALKYDDEYFYGMGCAQRQITNRFFQKATAAERARVNLAVNLHSYLLAPLDGDTSAARTVIEAVLPAREPAGEYRAEDGRLCLRTRLARSKVEELLADILKP